MNTPTFDRSHVGKVLRQMRLAYANTPHELTAINKAALNLEACRWQFDGHTLRIESATQTGKRFYTVTGAGCTCSAAAACRICWHVAAWRLLLAANLLATPLPPAFEKLTAETNAALFG